MNTPLNLEGLNPQQGLAVTSTEGPVMVVAGPGSGKTRVLTHRIAYLMEQGVPDHQIVAVTFTNKAADEMKDRTEGLLGRDLRGTFLGTFHAFCALLLRRNIEFTPYKPNFTIYDTSDQKGLLKQIIGTMGEDSRGRLPGASLNAISKAKNELIRPEDFDTSIVNGALYQRIYQDYMRLLRQSNALDFDDLLMQTVVMLEKHPDLLASLQARYRYIMVDEFQDTNTAQYRLAYLLTHGTPEKNIFIVGDPDQSIYAFRGADYRNLKRFQADFPQHQQIILDQNYRSHQLILDAAMSVIRHNPDHIKRDLVSKRKSGPKIVLYEAGSDIDEAHVIARQIQQLRLDEGYSLRDVAIMYRTNALSRILENIFRDYSFKYRIVGGLRFYERREIKDMLAFLHVVNNPDDMQRLLRVVNIPPRGIGEKSQQLFRDWVADRAGAAWAVLQDISEGQTGPLGRAALKYASFVGLLKKWRALIAQNPLDLPGLYDLILKDTDYLSYIGQDAKSDEELNERKANLAELKRELAEYAGYTLTDYLNRSALLSEGDKVQRDDDALTLMTLHAAKGLEFPVVFIVGVEEGLMPHSMSQNNPQELAEERRLFYVGITRAKDRLYLTYARERVQNSNSYGTASPFLRSIPSELMSTNTSLGRRSNTPPPSEKRAWQWQAGKGAYTPAPASTPAAPARKIKPARFQAGEVVRHRKFGQGMVMKSIPQEDFEEVEVRFESGEIKRLDANYLEKP